jgi:hypothetical protein
MTNLLSYSDYCKEFIKNRLQDLEGLSYYACDFASELTMGINVDGTATYSTYKAKEYLREWWDDCADYFQYEKDNFGQNLHNPFEAPEVFHVCMIIEGVSSLLSQCTVIDQNWDDKIEITKEVIDSISEEIENYEVQF